MNNKLTITVSICALAAAFAAGALTVRPGSNTPAPAAAAAVATTVHGEHGAASPDATSSPAAADPTEIPTITISGFAFETPVVPAGSTVRVVNLDGAPHTVTANDGSFTLFLEAGAEGTIVAPAAGSYDFFCEVHPSMTSTLVVT